LHLVDGDVDAESLDAAADALRAALSPDEIDAVDSEAIISLALGTEMGPIDDGDRSAAEALRMALDGHGRHELADLAASLRSAHRLDSDLDAIDEADHEVLLALTVGDAGVDFDAEQLTAAAALRDALQGQGQNPLAEIADSIRACSDQLGDIDELSHQRILRRTVYRGGSSQAGRASGRGSVVATIVALAAGIALFAGSWQWLETQAESVAIDQQTLQPAVDLAVSRSTTDLFDPMLPFSAQGGESDRIGRIVSARAADLRANRFASWGVR